MINLHTSLKKFKWRVGGHLFGFGVSPQADWKIIFISTLVLTLLALVLSGFIFIKIDKGEIFVVDRPLEQRGKTLDISLLKETISYYQGKAREFERTKNLVVPATDPSL